MPSGTLLTVPASASKQDVALFYPDKLDEKANEGVTLIQIIDVSGSMGFRLEFDMSNISAKAIQAAKLKYVPCAEHHGIEFGKTVRLTSAGQTAFVAAHNEDTNLHGVSRMIHLLLHTTPRSHRIIIIVVTDGIVKDGEDFRSELNIFAPEISMRNIEMLTVRINNPEFGSADTSALACLMSFSPNNSRIVTLELKAYETELTKQLDKFFTTSGNAVSVVTSPTAILSNVPHGRPSFNVASNLPVAVSMVGNDHTSLRLLDANDEEYKISYRLITQTEFADYVNAIVWNIGIIAASKLSALGSLRKLQSWVTEVGGLLCVNTKEYRECIDKIGRFVNISERDKLDSNELFKILNSVMPTTKQAKLIVENTEPLGPRMTKLAVAVRKILAAEVPDNKYTEAKCIISGETNHTYMYDIAGDPGPPELLATKLRYMCLAANCKVPGSLTNACDLSVIPKPCFVNSTDGIVKDLGDRKEIPIPGTEKTFNFIIPLKSVHPGFYAELRNSGLLQANIGYMLRKLPAEVPGDLELISTSALWNTVIYSKHRNNTYDTIVYLLKDNLVGTTYFAKKWTELVNEPIGKNRDMNYLHILYAVFASRAFADIRANPSQLLAWIKNIFRLSVLNLIRQEHRRDATVLNDELDRLLGIDIKSYTDDLMLDTKIGQSFPGPPALPTFESIVNNMAPLHPKQQASHVVPRLVELFTDQKADSPTQEDLPGLKKLEIISMFLALQDKIEIEIRDISLSDHAQWLTVIQEYVTKKYEGVFIRVKGAKAASQLHVNSSAAIVLALKTLDLDEFYYILNVNILNESTKAFKDLFTNFLHGNHFMIPLYNQKLFTMVTGLDDEKSRRVVFNNGNVYRGKLRHLDTDAMNTDQWAVYRECLSIIRPLVRDNNRAQNAKGWGTNTDIKVDGLIISSWSRMGFKDYEHMIENLTPAQCEAYALIQSQRPKGITRGANESRNLPRGPPPRRKPQTDL